MSKFDVDAFIAEIEKQSRELEKEIGYGAVLTVERDDTYVTLQATAFIPAKNNLRDEEFKFSVKQLISTLRTMYEPMEWVRKFVDDANWVLGWKIKTGESN